MYQPRSRGILPPLRRTPLRVTQRRCLFCDRWTLSIEVRSKASLFRVTLRPDQDIGFIDGT